MIGTICYSLEDICSSKKFVSTTYSVTINWSSYICYGVVCKRQTTYLFDLKFLGESSSYRHRSDLMFPSLLSVPVFSSENSSKNKDFSFK